MLIVVLFFKFNIFNDLFLSKLYPIIFSLNKIMCKSFFLIFSLNHFCWDLRFDYQWVFFNKSIWLIIFFLRSLSLSTLIINYLLNEFWVFFKKNFLTIIKLFFFLKLFKVFWYIIDCSSRDILNCLLISFFFILFLFFDTINNSGSGHNFN